MAASASLRIEEWIYTGFCIVMIPALVAQICSHDETYRIVVIAIESCPVLISINHIGRNGYQADSYPKR